MQPHADEAVDKPAAPGSSVLRLRGLPFQATEEDIKEFFSGYELKQIFICRRGGAIRRWRLTAATEVCSCLGLGVIRSCDWGGVCASHVCD